MTISSLDDARTQIAGSMTSVATPATPDMELDLEAYRRNLEFMVAGGAVAGNAILLVAAAGGEFPMLSVAERKVLMTVAVETVGDRVPIAASVQSNSTREAVELARHAQEVGVTVGQLSAPYYYPPTPEDIYEFFKDVATQSGLPIMVYNNWWNTLNMNSSTVMRLSEIDGVVAVKWSAPTFEQYAEGYELFHDRLAIIDNTGQRVHTSMLGASAFITHVGNFWPEYPTRIWELIKAKDYEGLTAESEFETRWARWTERVNEYTEGEGPFVKAGMDEVGLPSGDPFRPGLPVPDALRAELTRLFDEYEVPRIGRQRAGSSDGAVAVAPSA
jgi:dihydrodipicolinate synthase/N-acetylneuraminate lyase